MTRDEVVALMKTSRSEAEWNSNCDKVKEAFGRQYPDFWWEAIQLSGVASNVIKSFGGQTGFSVKSL